MVRPDDTVERAREEMDLGEIRHLPVVDASDCVIGMLSHRDLLTHPEPNVYIRDVMIEDVITVGPDVPAHEAAYLLLRHRIGSVPVCDDAGHILGIVTETDFVRAAYSLLGGQVPVEELMEEEKQAEDV